MSAKVKVISPFLRALALFPKASVVLQQIASEGILLKERWATSKLQRSAKVSCRYTRSHTSHWRALTGGKSMDYEGPVWSCKDFLSPERRRTFQPTALPVHKT